jgi:DNA-binding transcriptional ArsR family regulator
VSSGRSQVPDYDLEDLRVVTAPAQVKALFHPLRSTLLELVLERAATVAELAEAVGRPRSTVAYHVGALVEAGLLAVVRTRRVRAVQERSYGRTARLFYVGQIAPDQVADVTNYVAVAATESVPAHEADRLRAVLRYARIPADAAEAFWYRVFDVVNEFSQLPRSGEQVFGFVVGLYPTEHPTLPERRDGGAAGRSGRAARRPAG